MMCNYMRFGGCRVDPSPAWLDATRKVVAGLPQFVDEFEALLSGNEILMARTPGCGRVAAGSGRERRHHRARCCAVRA